LIVESVNENDCLLFNDSFFGLLELAEMLGICFEESRITFDSGFDSEANKAIIKYYGLIPVVYPNRRNTQDHKKLESLFEEMDYIHDVYKERYKIERCFAWEDSYRKLVIRYEKLHTTHMGFKYLAYSMINLRSFVGKDWG
jgi:transposase